MVTRRGNALLELLKLQLNLLHLPIAVVRGWAGRKVLLLDIFGAGEGCYIVCVRLAQGVAQPQLRL